MNDMSGSALPAWVPDCARRYLIHIEGGRSVRQIARLSGCHASTVLRQIRRVEARRDDPLVDAALHALATSRFPAARRRAGVSLRKEPVDMIASAPREFETPDADTLSGEAMRILPRLCEAGAVLAVATEMDKAVVVRETPGGGTLRTAVAERAIAEAMALKDWIACDAPGRVSRYRITQAGRDELGRMLAELENRKAAERNSGFAEAQAPFSMGAEAERDADAWPRRVRFSAIESPLVALSRRRDRDGKPFLDDALVRAGERLREDFELAQMGPSVAQNWDAFLTGGVSGGGSGAEAAAGPASARERVHRALDDLGPGLADVALRCCCFLEGLESAEKRMGWSARSGKIVLRIALQRLRRHYDDPAHQAHQMIG